MKSWFAKFRDSNEDLQALLRGSRARMEVPAGLHQGIMHAVEKAEAEAPQGTRIRAFAWRQFGPNAIKGLRPIRIGWAPASALIGFALVGIWFVLQHGPEQPTQGTQPLPEISTAFTAGQEIVESFPSATVGPLSEELENVNRDVDRTAEFLLATLP